jgi:hypothetical protein
MDPSATEAQVKSFHETYYQQNAKRRFNKNEQKFHCASLASTNFDVTELLAKTFTIFKDPNQIDNHVYFHYPLFKLYAHPDNYMAIVEFLIALVAKSISLAESKFIHFHVSMQGFTPTAAHRYRAFLELFSNECLHRQTGYLNHLHHLHLYHVPDISIQISQILLPLAPPEIRPLIKLYKKTESDAPIHALLNLERVE